MSDRVRILRVLEYEGPREWAERTLTGGAVPTNGEYRGGNFVIRSAILGQFPEIMEKPEGDPS